MPGMAGFRERPAKDSDPMVCTCGKTIGTRALSKPENKNELARVISSHADEHQRRLRHQNFHRGPADNCPDCPVLHDDTCRHDADC